MVKHNFTFTCAGLHWRILYNYADGQTSSGSSIDMRGLGSLNMEGKSSPNVVVTFAPVAG